jgi:hypothetical protein
MMNPIIAGAAVVGAIGSIGSGALYLDHSHVAASDFERYLAKERVRTIFDYLDQIRIDEPHPWLCRALKEEIIELCVDLPDHAICIDRDKIMDETNCEQ